MITTVHHSEVAQIRQRIANKALAATLGLCGLAAGTARHAFINARTEHLGKDLDERTQVPGSRDKALNIAITAMSSAEHPTVQLGDNQRILCYHSPNWTVDSTMIVLSIARPEANSERKRRQQRWLAELRPHTKAKTARTL